MKASLYILVPMIHLTILGATLKQKAHPALLDQKKLVVKTFAAPSKQQSVQTIKAAKKEAVKPAPAKKPKPLPKQEEKPTEKATPKTLPLPKKKEPVKKKAVLVDSSKPKSFSEQHLKEIEERIAKIEAKNDRMLPKSELTVPAAVALSSSAPLQIASDFAISDPSDDPASFLVGYLQASLELPDVGEVQIELTLRKDGSIEKIKVVRAESEKNKKYLEEHLAKLVFPPMKNRNKDSPSSFLLTFCNKF